MLDISQQILSDLVVFNKYAKYEEEINRRETWEELWTRNMAMHIRKYPQLKAEIKAVYKTFVAKKEVLPSMRSMQFGGLPIELSPSRIYNCAFSNADHPAVFWETMYNLLNGSGCGYSVKQMHIGKLPVVAGQSSKRRKFLVGDNIIGWADAIKVLVKSHFDGKSEPIFDFRDIRPKGAKLITSGGKAPGPDPLKICLDKINAVFNNAKGRRLLSIEVHDILCHIADAVLAGGIRRAAMISLFDKDDMDMLYSKSGDWWELNPQRGRANNSAHLLRGDVSEEEFNKLWSVIQASGAGEPGIVWTNDLDSGLNPCAEIGLRSNAYCNLTEINASDITTQNQLNERAIAAAFIGTLQAGYTDFHYLRPIWQENCEEEALIGVGMTGIASGGVLGLDLTESAKLVVAENIRVAGLININPAARTTCVKPSGTTSCVVGSSSGIHAWHNDYYIRRMRVGKNESLYGYLKSTMPGLLEDCVFKPHIDSVISIPQRAPIGAILRDESPIHLLERVKKFNQEWINPGHISGKQSHNVSCTVSIMSDEWDVVRAWMWENKDFYTGISVLPYDGHTYQQAPFEDCSKTEFERLFSMLKQIDLSKVIEIDDLTNLNDQAACGANGCAI